MNPRTSPDDPRYSVARSMFRGGTSKREICKVLGLRWETCAEWLKDVPAPAVVRKRPQVTPAPFCLGYRWFGTKWY